jgi:hypothetical protein
MADPIHPQRGVLAGHGFAMAFIKAYCIPPIDAYLERNTSVRLDLYVDDFNLTRYGAVMMRN